MTPLERSELIEISNAARDVAAMADRLLSRSEPPTIAPEAPRSAAPIGVARLLDRHGGIDWTDRRAQALRNTLALAYSDMACARAIAAQGSPKSSGSINWYGGATSIWFNLLTKAAQCCELESLVAAVLNDPATRAFHDQIRETLA